MNDYITEQAEVLRQGLSTDRGIDVTSYKDIKAAIREVWELQVQLYKSAKEMDVLIKNVRELECHLKERMCDEITIESDRGDIILGFHIIVRRALMAHAGATLGAKEIESIERQIKEELKKNESTAENSH